MLEIKDLVVGYGNIIALHGVSLHVKPGEIVALIGANGAGKTTLLTAISGLIRPKSGSVRFLGQELSGMLPEKVVRLGMSHVPEGRKIFPLHTVETNLDMGAYIRTDKKEIEEDKKYFLDRFPALGRMRKKSAGFLSGGEQQMLAISRALMSRPKMILMDEPSMGLSPLLVNDIFNIVKELHENKATIFLVEQNAHKALSVSERAYVMETGNIVLEGLSNDLLKDDRVREAYLGE